MTLTRVAADGTRGPVERVLAEEVPIAIEVNGIGYAVLMATPDYLEDLAVGFAASERLLAGAAPVEVDCHAATTLGGWLVRLTLDAAGAEAVAARVRHRTSESSCGLCGVENLEQAMRPLPRVTALSRADDAAVFRARGDLADRQPLNARTGGVHAAALCGADGAIRLVREDVGRHNAFDKLIGAMRRQGLGWDGGFALLTSRCSYELVEKAVLGDCPLLATISAPTALAVARAGAAGLPLRVLVRADALLST
ncbi:formate dehydrogenase family accessory protein FdhD [Sphingomonas sp. Leaf33]|uniref:formate dehydrogenase accessory sulfurtransferase FdhD n=1 Tax=Sphingomonas sp. Leaf33 TaxID=1736215 RepID=UPI0006FAB764|nr:formate dehydrogenase accessory sulfurtransferase FdhD [Sphingomonas sp. Leaf33]KQN25999.1 formate dehydrogenase family accessory protein FdhD [Sphingomonas sp. Leaf33]